MTQNLSTHGNNTQKHPHGTIDAVPWHQRNAGMTLVEVVISCMILGMTLSAFLMGFTANQKTATFASNRFLAINQARQGLETLTSRDYTDSSLNVGTQSFASNVTYVVSESNLVKTLTLTVRWVDPTRSRTSTLSLATCMAHAVHQ